MSKILYLCTAPPPALPGTDAVFQEIDYLRSKTGGSFIGLYPLKKPSRFVPHWMMGAHIRNDLKEAVSAADTIVIFSATLKPLPCIEGFSGRIIYTVTASAGSRINATWFNDRNVTVVAGHEREAAKIKQSGISSVAGIPPGIDLSKLSYKKPPDGPFRLMVGSAPWTKAQFETKGVNVLLEAMRQIPGLNVVFLWRNLWHDQLLKRLQRAKLMDRVEIHNKKVNVNDILRTCHAATVLAANERLVKAWPHSAIESLAAGKPVFLSRTIPMSEFVEHHRAGITVNNLNADHVVEKLKELMALTPQTSGEELQQLAQDQFRPERMSAAYMNLF